MSSDLASHIESLQLQLAEEQQRRREAERRQEEEQRQRENDRTRFESRIGKTAMPEFLHACHTYLYSNLTIQQDVSQSTQGQPANAENKIRPRKIVPWTDFADHQLRIWEDITCSEFAFEKHFTSLHTMEESGEQLRLRQLSSELDLHYFVRTAIENPVAAIVNSLGQTRSCGNAWVCMARSLSRITQTCSVRMKCREIYKM